MHRPLTQKVLVTKNKKTVTGSVMKITARQIHIEIGNEIIKFNKNTLSSVNGYDQWKISDLCGARI